LGIEGEYVSIPVIVFGAVICGFLGLAIGGGKGYAGFGFFLGAILGPLGLIIIAATKPTPAIAAAREEAIETERARLRAQREAVEQATPPVAEH